MQDISSMLVAHLAEPKEGDEIIDVCAAPGGKALHMAEVLCGTGHVQARDLTEYKVGLIEENILRSGMTNIEAVRWDATQKMKLQLKGRYCGGRSSVLRTGSAWEKTDLKYKMTEETQKNWWLFNARCCRQSKIM